MILKGKNAIITGSRKGIGKEIVKCFAKEGANIWAHAREIDIEFESYLQEVAAENNVRITPVYFDMTDKDEMKKAINDIRKSGEQINILINNAGVAHGGLFQMTPVNDIRKIFETNFFSICELTQMVARIMVKQKNGSIINMASISGLELKAGNCAYGTSKAALIALTKTLSNELAPLGIRVNAIAPGLTDTNMAKLMEEKAGEEMVRETAIKRLGQPSEIAQAVLYLASDNASFITGQVLRVDGGM